MSAPKRGCKTCVWRLVNAWCLQMHWTAPRTTFLGSQIHQGGNDMNKLEEIMDQLGEPEVLAQLAEEASELAQAALKLRRALDGKNYTPKTIEECRENLNEEFADVAICASALRIDTQWARMEPKINRWYERLKKTEKQRNTVEEMYRPVYEAIRKAFGDVNDEN